ncbi:MAG: hypothetical protein FJX47_09825, partial [Alphaproteobacteria bacterium]|nr:hypothetical protein [Alphaproteobacteria bacterium]
MVDTTAAVGAAEAPSGEAPASGGGASKAVLADRFEIDLRARLAELDSPTAQAYAAKENKTGARPVFALVCRPDIPVRSTVVRHLGDRPSPGTLTIFAGGTIDIGDGERRYAVILERPAGGRLWPRADKPAAPIPEKVILDKILPQLSAAVDALAQRGIIHRAIRPDNLYWLDPEGSHVVLGDCVTCLPGRGNPPVYETTERAMASPLDRGDGHAAEDYYALGVTVLALANGKDPAQGRDETALIATKVANGTYAALSVGLDVSAALAEPIRGLIADDAPHRWTHAEIKQMMSGRASRAPRAHIEKRASQAIRFKDTQIHHPRLLAMAVG